MNDEPGGLVDDEDMLVLVDDFEGDSLGFDVHCDRQGGVDIDRFTPEYTVFGPQDGPVHPDFARFDPFPDAGPRIFFQQIGQGLVQPVARVLDWDSDLTAYAL